MSVYSFTPNDLSIPQVHQYMLGGISPRPIAFVSTIADDGTLNLAPFSFFNAFGANPPVLAFSPARRGRDNTVKDTYNNLKANGQCVVNIVSYSMVTRMNLSSCEYDSQVNEFEKSGFTPLDSDLVRAKRVKESPFQMECKLIELKEIGQKAGSANLAICEVLKFHISQSIISNGIIDPNLLDVVARNGANYYTRASGNAIFELPKPNVIGIGIDSLPYFIRNSKIYSGYTLGNMGMNQTMPSQEFVSEAFDKISPLEATHEDFEIFSRIGDYNSMAQVAKSLFKTSQDEYKLLMEKAAEKAGQFNDVEKSLLFALLAEM